MERTRDPLAYLKLANELEKAQGRGKLKIYLGAAPGVGKTYEMLSDALTLRSQGIDVVIGAIVTHGRQEIEAMAQSFEKLALLPVEASGHRLFTLDLDGILQRSPALVLVDEAAFSNPEGQRHPKRWQDILALIDRGIDVYTTLNVQHLERLNDVIADLIGAPIYETVPDLFLEQADTIELVDLPAQELINRLKQGKVYLREDIARSQENFFQKNKLEILREFAFRVAAQKLEQSHGAYSPGGILVYLQDLPEMDDILRGAKRLSMRLRCDWYLLYDPQQMQVQDFAANLKLAESLGAKTRVMLAKDETEAILDLIQAEEITLWMLAKGKAHWWQKSSSLEHLAQNLRHCGIYYFEGSGPEKKRSSGYLNRAQVTILGFVVLALGLSISLNHQPILALSGLSFSLLILIRQYQILSQKNKNQTLFLDFMQNVMSKQGKVEVLTAAFQYFKSFIPAEMEVYLQGQDGVYPFLPSEKQRELSIKAKAIVEWVFYHAQPAGPGTSHFEQANHTYLPVLSQRGCLAVLGLKSGLNQKSLTSLVILLHQLGLILGREESIEQAHTQVLAKFQNQLRDQLFLGLGQQIQQPLNELIELLPQELSGHSCKPLLQRLSSHLQVMNYFNQRHLADEMSEQSLEDVILSVLQRHAAVWSKRPIHWFVEPNLPRVSLHLDLMRVVIENILDNIFQHANADDGIDISIHLDRLGILVSFADLGPGFPESDLRRIFDYFYQVQSSQTSAGLGLGLALCERIISWHHGQIWAENRKPHGAIFNFVLPLAKHEINGQNNEPND